jgi:hypothetical protein
MPTTCAVRTAVRGGGAAEVPVAASTAVEPALESSSSGTVLGRFPTAVYVRLASGAVLALVTSDGLRLPNALVVAATSRQAPLARHEPGSAAAVTRGVLVLDGVRYRPVRSWTPRSTTSGVLLPAAVAQLAGLLDAAPHAHAGEVAVRLGAGADALGDALRTGHGLADAADALLGLGPGLTPAGDDVLAGALVTYAHLGPPLPALAARVRARADATTALSADLLGHASAGRAAPPVVGLLDALVGARAVGPALDDLLAVGSTSGSDTATGVLLAARVLADLSEDG